ncbi:MAG: response regulator [Bacteroidales bacterium]|nr:response regulator [Bacteroidales bacterium]
MEVNSYVDNRVLDLFVASDGTLYAGTSIGAMRYDVDSDSFVKISCFGDRAIEQLAEDGYGTIWAATYSSGILAYDCKKDDIIGHWCVKGGTGRVPEMVSYITLDYMGHVFGAGFSAGFYRYDSLRGDFDIFDMSVLPGLPSDRYFAACPDAAGNLWLSSDKGLVRYNGENSTVKNFTLHSGLLDYEFGKAALRLKDGNLLFGSADGFIVFNPNDLSRLDNMAGDVIIHDFNVGGESVSPGKGGIIEKNINVADLIRLKATSNSFGFRFSMPVTEIVRSVNIYCLLDGYDSGWRNVSAESEIQYYNVPPGKYILRVCTMNSAGEMLPAHHAVDIEILPSFRQSWQGIFLIMLIVLAFACVTFAIIYYMQERKHRIRQEKIEKEKEIRNLHEKMTFFSNIVHEIKTPVTLIKIPLQNLMENQNSPEVNEELSVIYNSTDYLDKLVKELLDFIRAEKHGYVLDYTEFDMVERINFACFNFSELARSRNIAVKFNSGKDRFNIRADEKAVDKIINNLLHNAVKYAGSYINIDLSVAGENVVVKISNDGELIPESMREEIFKPFIRLGKDNSPYSQSFGIGLAFASTLATLHRGSLAIEDSETTTFVLTIPLTDEYVAGVEKSHDEAGQVRIMPDRSTILLVEDNYELQTYLGRKLKAEYNVIVSSSGEEALTLMKKYSIDLLITDIGLQGMSGVELCHRISSDSETSYVPVIVLSAITSVDTKIQCMESGVSMYIEKPFTLEYLMACIRGELNKRKQMKTMLMDNPVMNLKAFNLVDRDEDFLKKLEEVMAANISNADFGVPELEKALFMSRSSLTRKIHGLLDQTPVEYIRHRRLAVAAKMLRDSNCRKSEVCYAVGFRSPSYFSKCFREVYGKNPAEYAKEQAAGQV